MSGNLAGSVVVLALSFSTGGAFALTPDQQYQQELDRYHAQQAQYNYQREQYDRHLEGYYFDRAHPHGWWQRAYFRAAPDWYWHAYSSALIGAEVAERDGRRVGEITEIARGPDGHIDRVEIALGAHDSTWVDVEHIRFDRADRIAFVDLDESELYDRANYRP